MSGIGLAETHNKHCSNSRQINQTLSKPILVVKFTNLDGEEALRIQSLFCSFTLRFSATVAGPLTIKRNQCEHAETNSTGIAIIVNSKFGDGVQGKKVELNARETAERAWTNLKMRKEKRLESITSPFL